jgi:small subunit ribosomal protein S17
MQTSPTPARRRLQGTVVSTKMQKTIVVRVDRMKTHPKYHKQYVMSSRYKAHDAAAAAKLGDLVVIEETRPLSRDKRWRFVSVVTKGTTV